MKRFVVIAFAFMALPFTAQAAQVQEVISEKGIKAWLVEEHALPIVAVKIAFTGSGNAYDPDGKEGRANMTAALLMEGAGDMDARAFSDALESRAIAMNMGVDEDMLRVSVESLSEHLEKAFTYLGLALAAPRFDSGSIERVKDQTQSLLLEQQTRPGYLMHRAWQEIAYGAHPYGKPATGTKESVDALGRSDFERYREHYLTRGNIVIAVVGDITPKALKTLLDTHLGALPEKYAPDVTLADMELPAQPKIKTVEFDVPQTMVTFGTQGIKRSDPDYISAYVMNQILGGGGSLNAKLGQEIREKRGLAYSVFSGLNPMVHAQTWQGGFATRNDQVQPALDTLKKTLREFADHGPSDKEFNDAKSYLTGSFVLNLDSNADIANFLITMQVQQLGIDYLERRNALVEAVSKQSVEDMAKRLADPDKLLVVMVGKPKLSEAK